VVTNESSITVQEEVPDHDKPDNIVRPLTFSLAFDEPPRADVFELRVGGWRKYVVVALSDMLAVTDALAAAGDPLPLGPDPAGPRYFVSVSPFFGVSAEVAAQMAHWHIAHYLRLGFSGYTLYLNREYLAAFREHAALARWIAAKRLALILWDTVGMSRISIGDDWGSPANRMGNTSRLEERVYALQSTVYAHSLLSFWTGTRDNYVGLFDVDEYFAVRVGCSFCALSAIKGRRPSAILLSDNACCASDHAEVPKALPKRSAATLRRLTTRGTPSSASGGTASRVRRRCTWSASAPPARTTTRPARAASCRTRRGGSTSPTTWCTPCSASRAPANTPMLASGR